MNKIDKIENMDKIGHIDKNEDMDKIGQNGQY